MTCSLQDITSPKKKKFSQHENSSLIKIRLLTKFPCNVYYLWLVFSCCFRSMKITRTFNQKPRFTEQDIFVLSKFCPQRPWICCMLVNLICATLFCKFEVFLPEAVTMWKMGIFIEMTDCLDSPGGICCTFNSTNSGKLHLNLTFCFSKMDHVSSWNFSG